MSDVSWNFLGEAAGDKFGHSTIVSGNGNIIAVGGILNHNSGGTDAGHVVVYQYSDISENWYQIGNDIDGVDHDDHSGRSISLSTDGKIIAIGANQNDGGGSARGHVRIWEYSDISGDWYMKGSEIDGEINDENFGFDVSISNNGSIVAISGRHVDGGASGYGVARVYEYSDVSGDWIQRGGDFEGDTAVEYFGHSISLNGSGNRLAISSVYSDYDGNTNTGHVRVYNWDGSAWITVGSDISGVHQSKLGESVSLSNDGDVLAISTLGNDEEIQVYEYLDVSGDWYQLGDNLTGNNSYVSLSSNGKTLAFSKSDEVKIYEYSDTSQNWYIRDNLEFDESVESVSISDDGSVLAVGQPLSDEGGFHRGKVTFFSFASSSATSNICFIASTPIRTDQGVEQISKLITFFVNI